MVKIGIWQASQDTPGQRWWRRGAIAASILGEDSCLAPGRFERVMRQMSLSNGVARTTFPGRFADFDAAVTALLKEIFASDQALAVEDWAVSSGITAAEWFKCLKANFPAVQFMGSDAALFVVEVRRGKDVYILQADGTPLQYVRPPFVVSLVEKHSWLYAVNRLVQMRALRGWESIASQLEIPEWGDLDGNWDGSPTEAVRPGLELRRLPLLHPAVLALRTEAFRIRRHSVFSPLSVPVDVIRTMNILNRAYFSDAQLREAAAAIHRSLKPGGVWIVGRTPGEEPQHDATVYRKQAEGWNPLLRVGQGSELAPLVEGAIQSSES